MHKPAIANARHTQRSCLAESIRPLAAPRAGNSCDLPPDHKTTNRTTVTTPAPAAKCSPAPKREASKIIRPYGRCSFLSLNSRRISRSPLEIQTTANAKTINAKTRRPIRTVVGGLNATMISNPITTKSAYRPRSLHVAD